MTDDDDNIVHEVLSFVDNPTGAAIVAGAAGSAAVAGKKIKDSVDSRRKPEQGKVDRKTGEVVWDDKNGKKKK